MDNHAEKQYPPPYAEKQMPPQQEQQYPPPPQQQQQYPPPPPQQQQPQHQEVHVVVQHQRVHPNSPIAIMQNILGGPQVVTHQVVVTQPMPVPMALPPLPATPPATVIINYRAEDCCGSTFGNCCCCFCPDLQPERMVDLRFAVNGHVFGAIKQGTQATFTVPSGLLTLSLLMGSVGNFGALARKYAKTDNSIYSLPIELQPGVATTFGIMWRHPSCCETDFLPDLAVM